MRNGYHKTLPKDDKNFLLDDRWRCGATNRKGKPCKASAMKNGRCRNHGGLSTGAGWGKANPAYKSGKYTKQAINERKINALQKELEKHMVFDVRYFEILDEIHVLQESTP